MSGGTLIRELRVELDTLDLNKLLEPLGKLGSLSQIEHWNRYSVQHKAELPLMWA